MGGANSRGFVALQSSGTLVQGQELCQREQEDGCGLHTDCVACVLICAPNLHLCVKFQ